MALRPVLGGMVSHMGLPGPAPFVATAFLLAGVGAVFGAYWYSHKPDQRLRRVGLVGFGVLAGACFLVVTFFPLILGAHPSLARPSTTAQLTVLSPRPGEVFHGDPATVPVELQLTGGQVVPTTSLRLVPNEGHIHLYLDGSLVAMTGLQGDISAGTGTHTVSAEFVAIDHGPFEPRVVATVTFNVDM